MEASSYGKVALGLALTLTATSFASGRSLAIRPAPLDEDSQAGLEAAVRALDSSSLKLSRAFRASLDAKLQQGLADGLDGIDRQALVAGIEAAFFRELATARVKHPELSEAELADKAADAAFAGEEGSKLLQDIGMAVATKKVEGKLTHRLAERLAKLAKDLAPTVKLAARAALRVGTEGLLEGIAFGLDVVIETGTHAVSVFGEANRDRRRRDQRLGASDQAAARKAVARQYFTDNPGRLILEASRRIDWSKMVITGAASTAAASAAGGGGPMVAFAAGFTAGGVAGDAVDGFRARTFDPGQFRAKVLQRAAAYVPDEARIRRAGTAHAVPQVSTLEAEQGRRRAEAVAGTVRAAGRGWRRAAGQLRKEIAGLDAAFRQVLQHAAHSAVFSLGDDEGYADQLFYRRVDRARDQTLEEAAVTYQGLPQILRPAPGDVQAWRELDAHVGARASVPAARARIAAIAGQLERLARPSQAWRPADLPRELQAGGLDDAFQAFWYHKERAISLLGALRVVRHRAFVVVDGYRREVQDDLPAHFTEVLQIDRDLQAEEYASLRAAVAGLVKAAGAGLDVEEMMTSAETLWQRYLNDVRGAAAPAAEAAPAAGEAVDPVVTQPPAGAGPTLLGI